MPASVPRFSRAHPPASRVALPALAATAAPSLTTVAHSDNAAHSTPVPSATYVAAAVGCILGYVWITRRQKRRTRGSGSAAPPTAGTGRPLGTESSDIDGAPGEAAFEVELAAAMQASMRDLQAAEEGAIGSSASARQSDAGEAAAPHTPSAEQLTPEAPAPQGGPAEAPQQQEQEQEQQPASRAPAVGQDGLPLCVLCLESPRQTTLAPCGHRWVCAAACRWNCLQGWLALQQ